MYILHVIMTKAWPGLHITKLWKMVWCRKQAQCDVICQNNEPLPAIWLPSVMKNSFSASMELCIWCVYSILWAHLWWLLSELLFTFQRCIFWLKLHTTYILWCIRKMERAKHGKWTFNCTPVFDGINHIFKSSYSCSKIWSTCNLSWLNKCVPYLWLCSIFSDDQGISVSVLTPNLFLYLYHVNLYHTRLSLSYISLCYVHSSYQNNHPATIPADWPDIILIVWC